VGAASKAGTAAVSCNVQQTLRIARAGGRDPAKFLIVHENGVREV
jgi:hypothetical protein